MNEFKTWNIILEFFSKKIDISLMKEEEIRLYPYLEKNLLDSIEIVMMISEFENRCNIFFTQEDMQSEDFKTIGGLSKLIFRKTNNPSI